MNATMNVSESTASVVAPVAKLSNPNNEWRKSATQDAINAFICGQKPNLDPFKSFPWNDRDDDRNEKSFALSSLKHTLDYLRADTRDTEKMESRLDWLWSASGKLEWMQTTLLTKLVNVYHLCHINCTNYKGTDATKISTLALAKEQAAASLKDAKTKIEGLKEKIKQAGDLEEAYNKLQHDVNLVYAKRDLAKEIEIIISEREAMIASAVEVEATVNAEVQAILGDTAKVDDLKGFRKSKSYIKSQPAKARGEITTTLDNLDSALTHKAVASVPEKKITKQEAIALIGLPEDLFNEAVTNAISAGEEEVLSVGGNSPAVVLVRKSGAVNRFFVKQVVAA